MTSTKSDLHSPEAEQVQKSASKATASRGRPGCKASTSADVAAAAAPKAGRGSTALARTAAAMSGQGDAASAPADAAVLTPAEAGAAAALQGGAAAEAGRRRRDIVAATRDALAHSQSAGTNGQGVLAGGPGENEIAAATPEEREQLLDISQFRNRVFFNLGREMRVLATPHNRDVLMRGCMTMQKPLLERRLALVTMPPEQLEAVTSSQPLLVVDALSGIDLKALAVERAVWLYTTLTMERAAARAAGASTAAGPASAAAVGPDGPAGQAGAAAPAARPVRVLIVAGRSNGTYDFEQLLCEHVANLNLADFTVCDQINIPEHLSAWDVVVITDASSVSAWLLHRLTIVERPEYLTVFMDGADFIHNLSSHGDEPVEHILALGLQPVLSDLEIAVMGYAMARSEIQGPDADSLIDDALYYAEHFCSREQSDVLVADLYRSLKGEYSKSVRLTPAQARVANRQWRSRLNEDNEHPGKYDLTAVKLNSDERNALMNWQLRPQTFLSQSAAGEASSTFTAHLSHSSASLARAWPWQARQSATRRNLRLLTDLLGLTRTPVQIPELHPATAQGQQLAKAAAMGRAGFAGAAPYVQPGLVTGPEGSLLPERQDSCAGAASLPVWHEDGLSLEYCAAILRPNALLPGLVYRDEQDRLPWLGQALSHIPEHDAASTSSPADGPAVAAASADGPAAAATPAAGPACGPSGADTDADAVGHDAAEAEDGAALEDSTGAGPAQGEGAGQRSSVQQAASLEDAVAAIGFGMREACDASGPEQGLGLAPEVLCALTAELDIPLFRSFAFALCSMQVYLNARSGFKVDRQDERGWSAFSRRKKWRSFARSFEQRWLDCVTTLRANRQERCEAQAALRLLTLSAGTAPLLTSALHNLAARWYRDHGIDTRLALNCDESHWQLMDSSTSAMLLALADHEDSMSAAASPTGGAAAAGSSASGAALCRQALTFKALSAFDRNRISLLAQLTTERLSADSRAALFGRATATGSTGAAAAAAARGHDAAGAASASANSADNSALLQRNLLSYFTARGITPSEISAMLRMAQLHEALLSLSNAASHSHTSEGISSEGMEPWGHICFIDGAPGTFYRRYIRGRHGQLSLSLTHPRSDSCSPATPASRPGLSPAASAAAAEAAAAAAADAAGAGSVPGAASDLSAHSAAAADAALHQCAAGTHCDSDIDGAVESASAGNGAWYGAAAPASAGEQAEPAAGAGPAHSGGIGIYGLDGEGGALFEDQEPLLHLGPTRDGMWAQWEAILKARMRRVWQQPHYVLLEPSVLSRPEAEDNAWGSLQLLRHAPALKEQATARAAQRIRLDDSNELLSACFEIEQSWYQEAALDAALTGLSTLAQRTAISGSPVIPVAVTARRGRSSIDGNSLTSLAKALRALPQLSPAPASDAAQAAAAGADSDMSMPLPCSIPSCAQAQAQGLSLARACGHAPGMMLTPYGQIDRGSRSAAMPASDLNHAPAGAGAVGMAPARLSGAAQSYAPVPDGAGYCPARYGADALQGDVLQAGATAVGQAGKVGLYQAGVPAAEPVNGLWQQGIALQGIRAAVPLWSVMPGSLLPAAGCWQPDLTSAYTLSSVQSSFNAPGLKPLASDLSAASYDAQAWQGAAQLRTSLQPARAQAGTAALQATCNQGCATGAIPSPAAAAQQYGDNGAEGNSAPAARGCAAAAATADAAASHGGSAAMAGTAGLVGRLALSSSMGAWTVAMAMHAGTDVMSSLQRRSRSEAMAAREAALEAAAAAASGDPAAVAAVADGASVADDARVADDVSVAGSAVGSADCGADAAGVAGAAGAAADRRAGGVLGRRAESLPDVPQEITPQQCRQPSLHAVFTARRLNDERREHNYSPWRAFYNEEESTYLSDLMAAVCAGDRDREALLSTVLLCSHNEEISGVLDAVNAAAADMHALGAVDLGLPYSDHKYIAASDQALQAAATIKNNTAPATTQAAPATTQTAAAASAAAAVGGAKGTADSTARQCSARWSTFWSWGSQPGLQDRNASREALSDSLFAPGSAAAQSAQEDADAERSAASDAAANAAALDSDMGLYGAHSTGDSWPLYGTAADSEGAADASAAAAAAAASAATASGAAPGAEGTHGASGAGGRSGRKGAAADCSDLTLPAGINAHIPAGVNPLPLSESSLSPGRLAAQAANHGSEHHSGSIRNALHNSRDQMMAELGGLIDPYAARNEVNLSARVEHDLQSHCPDQGYGAADRAHSQSFSHVSPASSYAGFERADSVPAVDQHGDAYSHSSDLSSGWAGLQLSRAAARNTFYLFSQISGEQIIELALLPEGSDQAVAVHAGGSRRNIDEVNLIREGLIRHIIPAGGAPWHNLAADKAVTAISTEQLWPVIVPAAQGEVAMALQASPAYHEAAAAHTAASARPRKGGTTDGALVQAMADACAQAGIAAGRLRRSHFYAHADDAVSQAFATPLRAALRRSGALPQPDVLPSDICVAAAPDAPADHNAFKGQPDSAPRSNSSRYRNCRESAAHQGADGRSDASWSSHEGLTEGSFADHDYFEGTSSHEQWSDSAEHEQSSHGHGCLWAQDPDLAYASQHGQEQAHSAVGTAAAHHYRKSGQPDLMSGAVPDGAAGFTGPAASGSGTGWTGDAGFLAGGGADPDLRYGGDERASALEQAAADLRERVAQAQQRCRDASATLAVLASRVLGQFTAVELSQVEDLGDMLPELVLQTEDFVPDLYSRFAIFSTAADDCGYLGLPPGEPGAATTSMIATRQTPLAQYLDFMLRYGSTPVRTSLSAHSMELAMSRALNAQLKSSSRHTTVLRHVFELYRLTFGHLELTSAPAALRDFYAHGLKKVERAAVDFISELLTSMMLPHQSADHGSDQSSDHGTNHGSNHGTDHGTDHGSRCATAGACAAAAAGGQTQSRRPDLMGKAHVYESGKAIGVSGVAECDTVQGQALQRINNEARSPAARLLREAEASLRGRVHYGDDSSAAACAAAGITLYSAQPDSIPAAPDDAGCAAGAATAAGAASARHRAAAGLHCDGCEGGWYSHASRDEAVAARLLRDELMLESNYDQFNEYTLVAFEFMDRIRKEVDLDSFDWSCNFTTAGEDYVYVRERNELSRRRASGEEPSGALNWPLLNELLPEEHQRWFLTRVLEVSSWLVNSHARRNSGYFEYAGVLSLRERITMAAASPDFMSGAVSLYLSLVRTNSPLLNLKSARSFDEIMALSFRLAPEGRRTAAAAAATPAAPAASGSAAIPTGFSPYQDQAADHATEHAPALSVRQLLRIRNFFAARALSSDGQNDERRRSLQLQLLAPSAQDRVVALLCAQHLARLHPVYEQLRDDMMSAWLLKPGTDLSALAEHIRADRAAARQRAAAHAPDGALSSRSSELAAVLEVDDGYAADYVDMLDAVTEALQEDYAVFAIELTRAAAARTRFELSSEELNISFLSRLNQEHVDRLCLMLGPDDAPGVKEVIPVAALARSEMRVVHCQDRMTTGLAQVTGAALDMHQELIRRLS